MVDIREIATRTHLVVGGLFVVAVVLVGLFFLFGPRDRVAAPEAREDEVVQPEGEYEGGAEDRLIEDYAEGRYTGRVSAAERGDVIDSLSRGLVLVDYSYNRQAEALRGSIMNNTRQPFVDVEIAFRLLDADGDSVGAVGDTLPEIGPAHTQRFSIRVAGEQAVTSVVPARLTAALKDVVGAQRDPSYPQNDAPTGGSQDGARGEREDGQE